MFDSELIELLLTGSRERRRMIARKAIEAAECLGCLRWVDPRDLRAIGFRAREVDRLLGAFEMGRRGLVPQREQLTVHEPRDAYRCVAPYLLGAERERFVVVVLDIRNRPLRVVRVAEGSVDACPVDPREIFVHAVRARGSAVLVAHNHPSGDPTPSAQDVALTDRLRKAGEVLSLPLVDHIIVGTEDSFISLAEAGLLVHKASGWR